MVSDKQMRCSAHKQISSCADNRDRRCRRFLLTHTALQLKAATFDLSPLHFLSRGERERENIVVACRCSAEGLGKEITMCWPEGTGDVRYRGQKGEQSK